MRVAPNGIYDLGDVAQELCDECLTDQHEGWPSGNGGELCTMCWESECSRAWWAFVDFAVDFAVDALGLHDGADDHPDWWDGDI